MKKLLIATAFAGLLAGCADKNTWVDGRPATPPAAEAPLMLGVFAVAACFMTGYCS